MESSSPTLTPPAIATGAGATTPPGAAVSATASTHSVRSAASRRRGKRFWSQGEPLVWATGAALSTTLAMAALLLGVVLWNGLGVFWPRGVAEVRHVVGVLDSDGAIARRIEPLVARAELRLAALAPRIEQIEAKRRQVAAAAPSRRARAAAMRRDEELSAAGIVVAADASVELGGNRRLLDDGTVVLEDGSRRLADGSLLLVEGVKRSPDGHFELVVDHGGSLPLLEGRTVELDAVVTVPLVGASATGAPAASEEEPLLVNGQLVTERLADGRLLSTLLGEWIERRANDDTGAESWKFKKGNREDGAAFEWIEAKRVHRLEYPAEAFVLDRAWNLNYIGYLKKVDAPSLDVPAGAASAELLEAALSAVAARRADVLGPIELEEQPLAEELNTTVKYALIKSAYRRQRQVLAGAPLNWPLISAGWRLARLGSIPWMSPQGETGKASDAESPAPDAPATTPPAPEASPPAPEVPATEAAPAVDSALADWRSRHQEASEAERALAVAILNAYVRAARGESPSVAASAADSVDRSIVSAAVEELLLMDQQQQQKARVDQLAKNRIEQDELLRKNVAVFADAWGRERRIALVDIVRFWQPNQMNFAQKTRHYLAKLWELVSGTPREANQDGGIFPAIFGTVMLVFLMAITCFPLGVLAGIYLGEYAKEGILVRLVRIAVNNLAGIPSIVYGIFGLGFFVYLCGGALDRWLFPAMVEAGEPVLNKGCILWASLTLGLLTIPVVIVSTEEALRQIPRGVREGSYALGATKFQTLRRVLVPMASPGMMTGFILAMARAVGEVAPLMITGVVKDAPLPLSGRFPFIHLDRSFMHLGFHILDISCKSPNVEATKPLVYVTTLLLLLIVLTLTSMAIVLRNRMRRQYQLRAI